MHACVLSMCGYHVCVCACVTLSMAACMRGDTSDRCTRSGRAPVHAYVLCMCVCMCAPVHACVCTVCVVCLFICAYVCMCASVHACVFTVCCVFVYLCVCVRVCAQLSVCACVIATCACYHDLLCVSVQ